MINPEGIPFIQEKSMKISIYKDYLFKDYSERFFKLSLFVGECKIDWETKRLEFIEVWKKYKSR